MILVRCCRKKEHPVMYSAPLPVLTLQFSQLLSTLVLVPRFQLVATFLLAQVD